MKRLLSVCVGMIMCLPIFAQYALDTTYMSDPLLLKSKGCRIYAGAERLDKNEAAAYFSHLNGMDRGADYLRYRRVYNAGIGLTVAGSVITAAGFGLTMVGGLAAFVTMPFVAIGGGTDMPDELLVFPRIGTYAMISGVAFLGAGVPLICVYKKRIRTLVSDYNSMASASPASTVELSFGSQPSGIGFALRF